MAAPNFYQPGGLSGARWATRGPVATSGRVWYVCNATGANGLDAASPAGQQRTRPLASLAQAITNAGTGDTVQCLEGHVENTAPLSGFSAAGLYLISEGTPSTRAQLTLTSGASGLPFACAGGRIENITFSAPTITVASGNYHLRIGNSDIDIVNCSFDLGTGSAVSVRLISNSTRFIGCTFTSVATASATRPVTMFEMSGSLSNLMFDTCTFDGGAYGWSSFAANFASGVTRLTVIDCDFLNDSDLFLATGSTYRVHRRNVSGSSYLELTA